MKRRVAAILMALCVLMLGAQTALCVDIPEERQLPRLVDRADLLTDQEEADLLARLDEISQRRQCDVAVVTVETLEGKTARAYADDFYDANGYGMGSGDDGILLLVCMGSRDWWITTYGLGTDAMTDAALDYVSQSFLPDLSSGNYSGAFTTFATLSDRVIGMALEGQPFREEDIPEPYAWWYIPVALGIGFIPAIIAVSSMKRQLRTVRRQSGASDYTKAGSFAITDRKEIYLYQTMSKRARPKDTGRSSGSSGGSRTHVSSSGRSHGGGGGKF